MKFTDGVWRKPDDMNVATSHHCWSVTVSEREAKIDVSSSPVRMRFEDQETKYFTVRLHSPAPNIIGVKFEHFRGRPKRGPDFELTADASVKPTIVETEDHVSLTSGDLTARVEKRGEWRLDFLRAGKRITGNALGASGYAVKPDEGKTYV